MAEDRPSLCSIPPELLELILTYTDEGPRSKSDVVYDQPTLNFISCRYKHPPLKSLSRVSRGFRQLLLHRVFQHTIQLVTAEDRLVERQVDGSKYSEWPMCKFYSFINFIDEKELNHVVQTFTLAIKAQPQFDVLEYHDNGRQSQLTEYNSRWRLLLLSLMPMIRQVTIIAPPTVLGVLAGVPVGPESIIKLHMPYQLLSLWRTTCNWKQVAEDTDPEEAYEKHSLFMLYAWTGLLLNEGSFLRAHAPSRFPSTNWQNNMFMSDHFLQRSRRRNMFQHLKSFSYIGLWAPQEHLQHVVRFAGSLQELEVFRFSLQTMFPLLDDPLQIDPINQQTLAAVMQESYPEMMYIFNQAAEVADTLEIESCFENLRQVVCLDSADVVDFGTIHEPTDAWYWMNDDTESHSLIRLEASQYRKRQNTSPF